MGRDFERQRLTASLYGAEVSLTPEIANTLRTCQAQPSKIRITNLLRRPAEVTEANGDGAVLKLFEVHTNITDGVYAFGLLAESVLIERYHLVVG